MIARKATPVPILTRSLTPRYAWPLGRSLLWFLLLAFLLLSGSALAQAVDPVIEQPPATAAPEPEPAAPTVTDEPPLYKSRSERDNQLLANAAAEEVRWLETPGEQALALFRPIETRTNKGALLILHAAEIPPGWPPALENVRRALPQHGWVTLALALPPRSTPPLPEREPAQTTPAEPTASEDPTAEPAAQVEEPAATAVEEPAPTEPIDEPLPTRAEVIAQRLEAALAWLTEEQHAPVFLLIDNSSLMDSLAYLQTRDENPIAAMILVNLQAHEPLTTAELETIFTATAPPTLDVFFQPGKGQVNVTRKAHRAVALRNKMPVYQQLHLPPQRPSTVDDEKSFWVERMRGFMGQQSSAQ